MADEAPDPLDYPRFLGEALRLVVKRALQVAAEHGLPGDHHFYLSFATDAPGVYVPPAVKRNHPGEMTIVLQHQFWNLEVEEDVFRVDLRFGGAMSRIAVPFSALTAFADPSTDLALRFDMVLAVPAGPAVPEPAPVPKASAAAVPADGNVVDISAFRKKT
jgi:hypothetical protein